MGRLPRGLCAALTLWLAMSRPSAANRTESPYSFPWWAAEEFTRIQQTAGPLRQARDFSALEKLYRRGVEVARRSGSTLAEASYWSALGNVYVYLLRYAEAVQAYEQASDLAAREADWLAVGAVAPGLSSVYYLAGDLPAARHAVDAGLDAVRRLGTHPYYEAQLKLQHARVYPGGESSILEAIDAARAQGDVALEAQAWDLLGEAAQMRSDLANAEHALGEALRLRQLHQPRDLQHSYWRLGALRLSQGRLDEAEQLTLRAVAANQHAYNGPLDSALPHQLGQIRLARGETAQALQDFQSAMRIAEQWRAQVPPSPESLDAADAALDRKVFRSFIETAARAALRTGNRYWAGQALLAVERNRAAALRSSTKKAESFLTQDSLTHFQQGLRDSELFLSFYTGAEESYLWAVTRRSLHLYRLPAADTLGAKVRAFRDAITGRLPLATEMGERLYTELFGQLNAWETKRPRWLLSLDGALFELPAAALHSGGRYLVETHSLQTVPSAALLDPDSFRPRGGFLGIGDPIYNWADPRWHGARARAAVSPYRAPGQLSRLVASQEEVEQSAARWPGEKTLLTGTRVSRREVLNRLKGQPAVIHLATHVVGAESGTAQAFIALSLGASGSPELLSSADVARLDVPGALVVMTGCSSGTGEIRPGAGLLGLTRGWLAAGARAVLATGWPVEDARGDLLPAFYRELTSVSAAEALQKGQVEMIHSGTWQADPAYWAAFQLTGGVR